MNDFLKNINTDINNMVESVMSDEQYATNYIVIYSGRFQPFHKSHNSTYSHLVQKFGKDNVFIASSNKHDAMNNPFSFSDKKRIMNKMFGIPTSKIIQVKNTYSPKEITAKFDPETTAVITVVGEKDGSRLSGKYFKLYKNNEPMLGYLKQGYVYISPSNKSDISGTYVRTALKNASEPDKQNILKSIYPKVDASIFNMLIAGISEAITESDIIDFLENNNLLSILSEASDSTSAGAVQSVDDGPRYHYPNHSAYKNTTGRRATAIGYTVIDYIIRGAGPAGTMAPDYPDGPVDAISYFPAGVAGEKTPMNQEDIIGSKAWDKWFTHVTRSASLVGYTLIKSKDERVRLANEKKQSVDNSKEGNNVKFNQNTLDETTLKLLNRAILEFQNSNDMLEIAHQMDGNDIDTIKHCIEFTFAELNIAKLPTIRLTNEREDIPTTAYYRPDTHEIKVYTKNRALADVLRSIVHEIVHHQQNLEGRLVRNEDSKWAIDDTDPWETEAHAMAGHIITKFKHISEKNIYLNENTNGNYSYLCLMANTDIATKKLDVPFGMGSKKDVKGQKSGEAPVQARYRLNVNEELLLEGGAYGHMSHPFEDMNLTFGDLKILITNALQGNLEMTTEKCIAGESIITTDVGPVMIQHVVDSGIGVEVLAYDESINENVFRPITNRINNGETEDWLEIETEDGNVIVVTPNHRIFTNNRGYIRADELTENDSIKTVKTNVDL